MEDRAFVYYFAERVAKCKGVSLDPKTFPRPAVPYIDIDDFRLDAPSMKGRKLRTRGVGIYMMDRFALRRSTTDMNPIVVDISKLPREIRRRILQECGQSISGCKVTIQGVGAKIGVSIGIVAESIDW